MRRVAIRILIGLAMVVGLAVLVGAPVFLASYRNLPAGMWAEFKISPTQFRKIDAHLVINGEPVDLHGVIRCRLNPYPSLSGQEDFSYPDAFAKKLENGREVILAVRSLCGETDENRGPIHYPVIDRHGDVADVYLNDSPQLAGSKIVTAKAQASDFNTEMAGFLDVCDNDGFSNTSRIGVWHGEGHSFAGDMVSPLGPPVASAQIDDVSNYIDNTVGGTDVVSLLKMWRIRPLERDEGVVCASNDSFIGRGCQMRVDTRLHSYALNNIDGGNFPAIRIHNGRLQLGDLGVVRTQRVDGTGFAHHMRQTLRAGDRFFYVQRLEFCYAPVVSWQ